MHLQKPPTPAPQYHMGLIDVLTDVATRLHTSEALRPVVAAQQDTDKKTKGWDRLPPTAQRVILAASATTGNSIPKSPPPTIHRFLNTSNVTTLQPDYSLTYAGNNLYLPTPFCRALLQGHILAISDTDAPTGLSPLLTPPSSAGPENAQQRAMRIQVLLSMVQDRLSKEEATELLDQRFHVLMLTQELRHSTRNFVRIAGDYLGEGNPVCIMMHRGHVTLTALSGNMTRPFLRILSLGRTSWIGSIKGCRYSCTLVTRRRLKTWSRAL